MAETQAKAAEPAQRRKANYMLVFVALAALTVIEVAASFAIPIKWLAVLFLILLAIGKASLVVAYYMHLRFERIPLRAVALGPLILVLLLTAVLLIERSTLPR